MITDQQTVALICDRKLILFFICYLIIMFTDKIYDAELQIKSRNFPHFRIA